MNRALPVLFALGTLVLSGCSKNGSEFAGTYHGRFDVPDTVLDAMANSPQMAGMSREEIRQKINGEVWQIVFNQDGTYRSGPDSGTWHLDPAAKIVTMTFPASFKQGLINGFNRNPNAAAKYGDKYMVNVTELRLKVAGDGTASFDTNDFLTASGIDINSLGVDPDTVNLHYVFAKQ